MTKTAYRLSIAIAAAAILLAVPAGAQVRMRVDVPFQFLAGETVLPAGTYLVELGELSRLMTLAGTEKSIRVPVTGVGVRRTDGRVEKGALLFEKTGSLQVLRSAWNPEQVEGCTLYRSKTERDLIEKQPVTFTIAWAR